MRWLDIGCGLLLLGLAVTKLPLLFDYSSLALGAQPVVSTELSREYGILVSLATIAEGLLGVMFLVGRTPRLSAIGLVVLGATFTVWILVTGRSGAEEASCNCIGGYPLEFIPHVLLSSGLLFLGGFQSILAERVKQVRAAPDTNLPEVSPH